MKNKNLGEKIFDFIIFHFLWTIYGVEIICALIVGGIFLYVAEKFNPNISNDSQCYICILSAIIATNAFSFIYAQNKISEKEEEIEKKQSYVISSLKKSIEELKKDKDNEIKQIKEYAMELDSQNLLLVENIQKSYNKSGQFIADLKTFEYELTARYLETKSHPAHKKAQDVRELKQKTKEYIKEYKLMRYEYDMLFSLFPELENYLEYYSAEKSETIEEVKENYDYVQSWISKDEYSSLDENTRNQLALDRYIESRKKSKWAIGRDYEMFIGHEYEKKGYKVTYTGITDRLEDKGRDLIVQKDNEILIIQCKNWSKYKEIHENHICQLFGTTVQYNIENNSLFKATPVFITSATLSETALKFAEYLGVQVIQNKKLEEFPRIKCNINNKEKIYHLPFDQQYDRTIIGDQKGEFFAWTVQEAVDKGFRRAKKYFYVKQ